MKRERPFTAYIDAIEAPDSAETTARARDILQTLQSKQQTGLTPDLCPPVLEPEGGIYWGAYTLYRQLDENDTWQTVAESKREWDGSVTWVDREGMKVRP
ncbi:MAG TPA: hypothetical protein VMQ76_01260 [Terracidiphilus sp.]|nr:hypothetical protein [Terracidiphilus sp.]